MTASATNTHAEGTRRCAGLSFPSQDPTFLKTTSRGSSLTGMAPRSRRATGSSGGSRLVRISLAGRLYAPRMTLTSPTGTDYAFRTRQGALAQYVRLPATCLVNLPPNVNPVQAAGLTCAAMTAYQALFEVGALRQGQRVFINGASSAVGAFAVQLAKAAGCRVSGSASARNQEFVEGIGVDEVRASCCCI